MKNSLKVEAGNTNNHQEEINFPIFAKILKPIIEIARETEVPKDLQDRICVQVGPKFYHTATCVLGDTCIHNMGRVICWITVTMLV